MKGYFAGAAVLPPGNEGRSESSGLDVTSLAGHTGHDAAARPYR
jgi:hypothetical protein